MMSNKRDNNFTDKQLKGITLTVKSAAREYPFIKGWRFHKTYKDYFAHLYIELIIDIEKLSEEVGMEIKPYYLEKIKKGEKLESGSILSPFNWGDYGTEEWKEMGNKSYDLGFKIRELIKNSYTYLPNDMKIFYNLTISPNEYEVEVSLSVDGYVTSN